jgi:hypothetical protein
VKRWPYKLGFGTAGYPNRKNKIKFGLHLAYCLRGRGELSMELKICVRKTKLPNIFIVTVKDLLAMTQKKSNYKLDKV